MKDKDTILLENLYNRIILNEMPLYHAGLRKISIDNIDFDRGAIGFHVGSIDQADDRRKIHASKKTETSEFEIYPTSPDGKLETNIIERDFAWEHADGLLIELVVQDLIESQDAQKILDSWYNKMDSVHWDIINDLLVEVVDDYDFDKEVTEEIPYEFFTSPETYKNKQKLSQIRLLLVNKGIGAIKYKNEVEGNSGYSFVIFDKRMIAPKNIQIIPCIDFYYTWKELGDILNGTLKKLVPFNWMIKKNLNYDKYVGKKIAIRSIDDTNKYGNIVAYIKLGNKYDDGYEITNIERVKPFPYYENPNVIYHLIHHEPY